MATLNGDRPKTVRFTKQQGELELGQLTDEMIEDLRAQARSAVDLEVFERQKDDIYKQFLLEERRSRDPVQEVQPIFLQLAPSMPHIMLDGTVYLSDTTYHVNRHVFAVLIEQMNRGWAHEELTQVRSESGSTPFARRPSHVGIGNFMGTRSPRALRLSASALPAAVGAMQGMMQS